MNTARLEAFSDGVIAVAITIMVLEIGVPEHTSLTALGEMLPHLLVYVLSFVYVGIYWSNHHHMLQAAERVNGAALWANLHLLFWITLMPLTTAWAGENPQATWPTVAYGVVLLMAALAYYLLARILVRLQGPGSALGAWAVGMFEAKEWLREAQILTIRRPIVVLWVKNWRDLGPRRRFCSPDNFCGPGS